MDNNELATSVAQVVGQAIGEMSVGVAMAVLALTNAVSKQPGVDRDRLRHSREPSCLVDHGGVIMQKSVPVLEGDTPETLAARVLTVEHEILPESVRLFCAEKLGVDGRQVHVL